MDASDVAFEIVELLECKFRSLILNGEAKHGACPRQLKQALRTAFWKKYAPPPHWNDHLEEFRVIDGAVVYVLGWKLQETYIKGFGMRDVAKKLGTKGHCSYKAWISEYPSKNKATV